MSTRTAAERGREVRRALLEAATELIPELGWNAVSTRLLAQRAGVAPGLVHYHFQGLQVLLREAVITEMRRLLAATGPMLERAENAEAGLGAMLGFLDDYTGDDAMSLLFIEAYLAATRDEELRVELAGLVDELRQDLARWLGEHGRAMPEETASVLAAAIDGVLLHRALKPELGSALVAPVLRRLLVPAEDGEKREGSR